jgi:hypothetical protein
MPNVTLGHSSLGMALPEAVQRPLASFARCLRRDAQAIGDLSRTLTNDDDSDDQVGMGADLLAEPIPEEARFLIRIAARRNAESRWAGRPRMDAVAAFVSIVAIGKLGQTSPFLTGAP